MTIHFEPALEAVLRDTGRVAESLGAKAFGVGGVVRDAMLAHPNKDLDVTVVGDAPAVAAALAGMWDISAIRYSAFSTAVLERTDGFHVDIVQARSETYRAPGALPDITPEGLEADLQRRDFSVNAMAVSVNPTDFGALVDPLGGEAELRGRVLRILHPGSFLDDPTRLFRASRYAVRYDLKPDAMTDTAAREAVAGGALDTVSSDRLRRELERICEERLWAKELAWLNRWGVWTALDGMEAVEMALRRADTTLAWAARALSDALPDVFTLRRLAFLAFQPEALWPRVSTPPYEAALLKAAGALGAAPETPEGWRTLDERTMTELLLAVCLARTDAEKRRLTRYLTDIRTVRLSINGADLIAAGVSPGPGMGLAIRETLDAARLGRIHGADEEREHALRVWKNWKASAD